MIIELSVRNENYRNYFKIVFIFGRLRINQKEDLVILIRRTLRVSRVSNLCVKEASDPQNLLPRPRRLNPPLTENIT